MRAPPAASAARYVTGKGCAPSAAQAQFPALRDKPAHAGAQRAVPGSSTVLRGCSPRPATAPCGPTSQGAARSQGCAERRTAALARWLPSRRGRRSLARSSRTLHHGCLCTRPWRPWWRSRPRVRRRTQAPRDAETASAKRQRREEPLFRVSRGTAAHVALRGRKRQVDPPALAPPCQRQHSWGGP